jgi:dTDP-4-dehydrorhamnose reductase
MVKKSMKIVILGSTGQLGQTLQKKLSQRPKTKVLALDRSTFDLTLPIFKQPLLIKGFKPDYIVNCAGYTHVDKAESEIDKAMLTNGYCLKGLSEFANSLKAHLIHISTDFVFDGSKNRPYKENDSCNPLSMYGRSKLLGEQLIQQHCESSTIFRTSWLYTNSHPCFLKTMLRLASERNELKVVDDQVGTPTSANSLADALIIYMNESNLRAKEVYHFSNLGVASWYDFAHAIFKTYKINTTLLPVSTSEYPTPARRPAYSVLSKSKFSKTGFNIPHWMDALELDKSLSGKNL